MTQRINTTHKIKLKIQGQEVCERLPWYARAGAVYSCEKRERIILLHKSQPYSFPEVIHPKNIKMINRIIAIKATYNL